MLNALDRIVTGYADEIGRVRQDLVIPESQLRDYQARLGKPFLHEAYLSEMTGLRDQLKAGLSGTSHQTDESRPTVSELADQIKALKGANSIDVTPQRVQRKHISAEEPITARIRRRQEAMPAMSEQAVLHDERPHQASAKTQELNSTAISMTFQERILRERQHNADGEGHGPT